MINIANIPLWARKFYKSKEWRDKRLEILKRDHFECQKCKAKGKYTRARYIHHIKELIKRPDLKLDGRNLTSLCFDCHEKEHKRFAYKEKNYKFMNEERW